jgi:hypothetical protein
MLHAFALNWRNVLFLAHQTEIKIVVWRNVDVRPLAHRHESALGAPAFSDSEMIRHQPMSAPLHQRKQKSIAFENRSLEASVLAIAASGK